jgi:hypothetical protein
MKQLKKYLMGADLALDLSWKQVEGLYWEAFLVVKDRGKYNFDRLQSLSVQSGCLQARDMTRKIKIAGHSCSGSLGGLRWAPPAGNNWNP